MSLRDSLGKAARLLFVLPPEEPKPAPAPTTEGELDSLLAELERKQEAPTGPTRTVEEIVREAAGPNLDQIRVDSAATAALAPDGVVDFAAIYTAAEAEIVELQARIEARRQSIQSAQQTLFQTTQRCAAESDRLDDVLEFFSLDVAPSK